MADVNIRTRKREAEPPEPRKVADEAVREGIELLFFAYRDFTAEPDAILAEYGFGRAHHRVVHFVGRHPQMTVGELLGILRITKQSLNRVLGQLQTCALVYNCFTSQNVFYQRDEGAIPASVIFGRDNGRPRISALICNQASERAPPPVTRTSRIVIHAFSIRSSPAR